MSNQGCEGGLALGQEGTVQWEVTREYNTEPRAAARPEPELLTNAPVSLRVLTGMSSLEQRWRWYGNEGSFHPTALPGVSCIRTLTEGFMVRKGPQENTTKSSAFIAALLLIPLYYLLGCLFGAVFNPVCNYYF